MVLAFLLNAFFYISSISKNLSLLITSAVMAMSYFTSNHFIDLSASRENIYISWILYDILTILLIISLNKLTKQKVLLCGKVYDHWPYFECFILFLLIHIDLRVLDNREPWWFWYFYTLAINTIDVIMVASLILDRDFLCIKFFKNRVKKYFSKRQKTISA